MNALSRTFTCSDASAARAERPVPLLIGLTGPSGCGKTFSALRLATGIQSVVGGEIFVVDTEQRRSLHYENQFKFKHVPFSEPFSSLDYLAALRFCKEQGAGVVVIDSCSHEHEGPGGLLEQHEEAVTRMAGNDYKKRDRVSILAWGQPKAKRRKLISAITSELDMPVIFCFRAKTGTKPVKGGDPIDMGFSSIGAPEWMFEMAWTALMLPGSRGIPTWQSDKPGERNSIKMVDQFEWLMEYGQLDETVGKRCAEWARGDAPIVDDPAVKWVQQHLAKIDRLSNIDELELFEQEKGARLTELQQKRPDLHQTIAFAIAQRKTDLNPEMRNFSANDAGGFAEPEQCRTVDAQTTHHEASADQIIAAAGRVETLIDLNNLKDGAEMALEDMPAGLSALVNGALNGAEHRLRGGK